MKRNEKKELIEDRDWYEALYWSRIDAFNKLKDAWKAHDPEWEMIDKIAKNIIIKTKPDYIEEGYNIQSKTDYDKCKK